MLLLITSNIQLYSPLKFTLIFMLLLRRKDNMFLVLVCELMNWRVVGLSSVQRFVNSKKYSTRFF